MPTRAAARLSLLAALLAGVLLAVLASRTPAPRSPDAPATAFSAGRAMDDVRAIARAPHPTGSAENRRVRDYLVARLRGMGLEVRVAPTRGQPAEFDPERRGPEIAVDNIVAVLPGRDRTLPAVAVMAHYDSVPGSPGAADDAAGVAAALEIARALSVSGPPLRDVVILLTDGEELGLVGAMAFFPSERRPRLAPPDPLSDRIGAVLNMEARGGGGRVQMFETGPGNAGVIDVLRRHARRPSANSLSVYVYERMPNATDFTIARELGLPGLNYAFIGRSDQYHRPSSTPENLDQGSLQHFGDQVFPVARALASSQTLPARAPDAVYSDVLGVQLLAYPPWAGWLVLGAAIGLAAVAWRRPPPWRDVLLGVAGAVAVALATTLALVLGGAGVRLGTTSPTFANFAVYEAVLAALCLGAVLLVLSWLAGRSRSASGVWFGFVLFGAVLTVLLQLLAPTTAHTAAWPTLVTCAAAVVAARRLERPAGLAVAALAGALVLGQVGAWAHLVAVAVGGRAPAALAPFALLAVIPLAPLLLLSLQRGAAGPSARPERRGAPG